jgi:hypothetical protein
VIALAIRSGLGCSAVAISCTAAPSLAAINLGDGPYRNRSFSLQGARDYFSVTEYATRRHDMIGSSPMQYELCFKSLFDSGRGYAFPCDSRGRVDLNELSDRARVNYLFARAVVGRELAAPAVQPTGIARARM